ncbi:kinesin-like protein KIF24 isoform X2 [Labrus bergylta]|uniref:kinesin-like protein KIF24 isoform X2 n=1 Tax=Labrus bergylta TaxID=56723 RepID=UPI0033133C09
MEKLKQTICHSQGRWRKLKEKEREKEEEEMSFCLQECLRAVGLQHHYARFTSVGVCRAVHLSALTMEDFPILGIRSMEDRTRLFSLIQMVKNLDLESLEHQDEDVYYADDVDEVDRRSFNDDDCRGDEEIYDDEEENGVDLMTLDRSSSVCRRLDFSSKDPDHHQKLFYHPIYDDQHKASVTDVQPDCNTESACACICRGNNNQSQDSHYLQSGANSKPDITEGTSMYYSHIRLLSPPNPRPAAASSQRFSNKQAVTHKDRKCISRKEISCNTAPGLTSKQTPVYESKRTAGYNYGLPLSSPAAAHERQAGGQRISVCVRKRPQTRGECRRGEADVVTTPNGECVIVHESKEAVDLTQYILQHRFYFDQVFGEESSNEDVYRRTTYPLVQHVLKGGKATCFAYGQTGAGKTHTMLGSSPRRPGLYALAVRDIFTHLSNKNMHSPIQVYVSFFEIYCGQLYDLLDHRKRLFAREDGQKVVHIAGLRDVRVDSVSSLLKVIAQGTEERTQGVSGVNPLSSRSHALLQIQLRGPNQQVAGRMWFVDLAGSERASDTREPDRQSRMEGAEINQSLLALKECIRSLDQEQSHTPFRQSKLTQVLKDSFIGDSMTCMIANISPGHLATEHTLNTLRYADRVKELKGQGGLRGGRRGKTSPKRNLSKSTSSSSTSGGSGVCIRGKSPPKKPKLARQREAPVPTTPTTRLATGGPIFCSTPKSSRRREEVKLEQITPVRGLLGTGDSRKTAGEKGGRRGRERFEESDGAGYSLGDQITRECGFYQRERGNQQSTWKGGIEGERRSRRQQRSGADSIGVEIERGRDLQKSDERGPSFSPSNASSASPSSRSSLRHSSRLSASAVTHQGLKEVLESCGAKADGGLMSSVPAGETSQSCRNQEEVGDGDSSGRVRRDDWRPAGMEGVGGRRWAWEAATETEQTGARPAAVEAQVSHNCDSEEWRAEGEDRSDIPDDGSWSNDSDGLFTRPAVESSHHRAPAERPLSPGCEHTNTLLKSNKLSEPSVKFYQTKGTSNDLPLRPQKSTIVVPSGSCREKKPLFSPDANTRQFSNTPSDTLSPTDSKAIKSGVIHQDASFSPVMDPLSISLLQVDQRAATSSFLRGEPKTSSLYFPDNGRNESRKGEEKKERIACLDEAMKDGGEEEFCLSLLEMTRGRTHGASISNHVTMTTTEQGIMKLPVPEALLYSLRNQEINQRPQTSPTIEVLSIQDPLKPSTSAASTSVTQSISSSVQPSRNNPTPITHNLKTHGATQPPPECAHKMHDKLPLSNSTTPSESVSGRLKTSPKQRHTVHSTSSSNSNISQRPNEGTESNVQGSTGNEKTGNMINLPDFEDSDVAQWRVIQAHWEQLEEMEALFHKDGNLLCQQPDMAFSEYVHKLEEIMERKARCVESMMAELQPYLKLSHSHSAHYHNQREHNNDPNT